GGYIGVVGKVLDDTPQTVGRHSARLALDDDKVDPDFLLAFFSTTSGAMLCRRWVSGSVQPGITLEDVREIAVPCPQRDLQEAVGNKIRKAERLRNERIRLTNEAVDELETLLASKPTMPRVGWTEEYSALSNKPPAWRLGMRSLSDARLDAAYYEP